MSPSRKDPCVLDAACGPQYATECDVFVLGTGLASLCLTRLLQLELPDVRIVAVDTGSGPARKVGESTVEIGAHFLNERLQLGALLRRTQLPKNGLRFWFDDEEHTQSLSEASEDGPLTFSYWLSFQLERDRLERDLVRLTQDSGAQHYFNASDIHLESGTNGVEASFMHDGDRRRVNARWTVDATGIASRLGRSRGAIVADERVPHGACWARFRGFRSPTDHLAACRDRRPIVGHRLLSTNHLMNEGYWIWWIPLASGLMSVGLVYDASTFRDVPRNQEEFVAFLRRHQMCRELMEDAEPVDFGALRNFAYKPKRYFWEDRTALIGMAAGFVDPFYSSGSDFIALECEYLCDLVRRDLSSDSTWRQDVPVYESLLSAFYEQTVLFVRGVYRSFASHELSVPRYRRDLHVYWNIYVWPYLSGELKERAFLDRFLPLAREVHARGAFFNRLFVHAYERLRERGQERRHNRGVYTFNQLGFRLYPYIRFERQMGHPVDLELSRRLLYEIDTGTLLAVMDALFDGDRSPVRRIVFDALHGERVETLLDYEREHGLGEHFWAYAFELLSQGLREQVGNLGGDPERLDVTAADFSRLRSLLAATGSGEPELQSAIVRRYLSFPELEPCNERSPIRAGIQPVGSWSFESTPWSIEPLDWRTAYEHMQGQASDIARLYV